MSEALNVELPPDVMAFARAEAAALGLENVTDYVVAVLNSERTKKAREQIAEFLEEGLQGEAREITKADWEALRQQVRERGTRNGNQP